jgi:hypothetical protein
VQHQPVIQRHLKTVGQEGDQDVGVGAVLQLMADRPEPEIAFQASEDRLDLSQLDVA